MKAKWKGHIIADSEDTVIVEGNHYFPLASLNRAVVVESATTTNCPWKGTAHYYTLRVDDQENRDAAWYYPAPKEGAEAVTDRVAFWKGVEVSG